MRVAAVDGSDVGTAAPEAPIRDAARSTTRSRTAWTICISPPGRYSSSTSSPMLDANSGMTSLSGKSPGRPTTHSDPMTGPAIVPRPPITAMATRSREFCTWNRRSVSGTDPIAPASSAPPRPAMAPESVKATIFVRKGDTVAAAALSGLSRTAIVVRPIPLRRRRAITTSVMASTATST